MNRWTKHSTTRGTRRCGEEMGKSVSRTLGINSVYDCRRSCGGCSPPPCCRQHCYREPTSTQARRESQSSEKISTACKQIPSFAKRGKENHGGTSERKSCTKRIPQRHELFPADVRSTNSEPERSLHVFAGKIRIEPAVNGKWSARWGERNPLANSAVFSYWFQVSAIMSAKCLGIKSSSSRCLGSHRAVDDSKQRSMTSRRNLLNRILNRLERCRP